MIDLDAAVLANEANWVHAFSLIGATAERGWVRTIDGIPVIATGAPSHALNSAFFLGPHPDPAGTLERVAAAFGADALAWGICTRVGGDRAIPEAAERFGLQPVAEVPGMALLLVEDVAPPEPSPLRIERVTDAATYGHFADLTASTFDMPIEVVRSVFTYALSQAPEAPWWVGYLDATPVAISLSLLVGDVVGVYSVGTHRDHRCRGLGAAMTRHAIDHGRALGCRLAVLQSSPIGLSVYRRMGFRTVATYRMFA